jgi:hypothetical protein
MAANPTEGDTSTAFDCLVGYDTYIKWEGTVPVVFDRAVSLERQKPLEVLGKVVPMGEDVVRLEGIALHQAASLGTGRQ